MIEEGCGKRLLSSHTALILVSSPHRLLHPMLVQAANGLLKLAVYSAVLGV